MRNQDNTYWAAVYSHSKLLAPFIKTQDVLIPSANDLNSHTVFEVHGFGQKIDIRWLDTQDLQITCRHCNSSGLLESKIDNIHVHLLQE